MRTGKVYVYFENEPETEEFDGELTMHSCVSSERCLFTGELEYAGLNDEWWGDYPKPTTGFYELEYEWDTEDERYDTGHVAYTYAVVVGIISMKKSLKARLLWQWNLVIIPKVDLLCSVFQRRWGVDFNYGGAGISSREMYLIPAIWRRFVSHRYFLPSWGPGYKATLRRY